MFWQVKNDIGVLLDNDTPNLDVRENRNWWHLRRIIVLKINYFHIHLFFLRNYYKPSRLHSECIHTIHRIREIRLTNKTINLLFLFISSSYLASISLSLFVVYLAIVLKHRYRIPGSALSVCLVVGPKNRIILKTFLFIDS